MIFHFLETLSVGLGLTLGQEGLGFPGLPRMDHHQFRTMTMVMSMMKEPLESVLHIYPLMSILYHLDILKSFMILLLKNRIFLIFSHDKLNL